jgi:glycosyltransferase involved in cell wall biosynthesis
MGFSGGSLEMLIHERRNGVRTVIDQIDPGKTGYDLIYEEERRYKAWAPDAEPVPPDFVARLHAEWDAAERVLVNSEWSRKALIQQGLSPQKIYVVPLPYICPESSYSIPRPNRGREPLRVLWLGLVSLGKGFAYALEAARRMEGDSVNFTFAGPMGVQLQNETLPGNCKFLGQVPRTRTAEIYLNHDVFLFPTLSDGFGLTQVEAMTYGLPVIATAQCGSVVQHGKSGLLIPARDPGAIVDAITTFLDSPDQLTQFSDGAIRRAEEFSPERVWPQYLNVFGLGAQSSAEDAGARNLSV